MQRRPKTRSLTAAERLRLLDLPDACLANILALACDGLPWKERCCLALVCKAVRAQFLGVAYASRPLVLNLNVLSWRIAQAKRKVATRKELLAAVARAAQSATSLVLKYQLDPVCRLPLASLLAPLAPTIQELEVEDGLSLELLDALAAPKLRWPALREVSMVGCMLWSDWQGAEVEAMEARLAALPDLAAKVVKFEGSCQGMEQGRESFFRHLPALRSLELEDWMAAGIARDYAPLRAMRHLTSLTLNVVEDLEPNLAALQSLTQVRELSLVGCHSLSRGLAQLPNLVLLDLQPLHLMLDEEEGACVAAAWKARGLTELRWCGDLVFDEGEAPIDLPHLLALEIDEAHFPPTGLPIQLCDALTGLTSLRLVGGRCPRLPPSVSRLAELRVLSVDSCQLPSMPASMSALTAVTNLQLSNTGAGPVLPHWVLGMPLRKMWLANNALTTLHPAKPPKMRVAEYTRRLHEWLARLTHVCLSSNQFTELPGLLLAHGEQLLELDLAYNPRLQISAKCASAVRGAPCLRRLRLEKSYFLPPSLRWTAASQRSISRLQRECPGIVVECQSHAVQFQLSW